jgi:hypothetical protein
MGHQLYLDHLRDALPPVVEWIARAVAATPGEVAG